jgi:hypothetical protein
VNPYLRNPADFDANPEDLLPMDEFEDEESDGIETTMEVELLLVRAQAMRHAGA